MIQQNEAVKNPMGKITVYACGGTGINVVKNLDCHSDSEVFAALELCFIDTSRSSTTGGVVNDGNFFQIRNLEDTELDGSGRVRGENAEAIVSRVREILNTFKPGDVSIVVSSGGGGSGSTIAPAITNELVQRGNLVIPVMIGSAGTRRELLNTLGTIKSYLASAINNETPIPMVYVENTARSTRGEINSQVNVIISLLALLFSRQNKGLDTKDLSHWLHYSKVAKQHPAGIAYIGVGFSADAIEANIASISTKPGFLVTLATVASDIDTFRSDLVADTHFEGYCGNTVNGINTDNSLYCGVYLDVMESVIARFESRLKELNEEASSRVQTRVHIGTVARGNLVLDD